MSRLSQPRPFLDRNRNVPENEKLVAAVAQVVERSPEKAGVGGSTPSRGTLFSITYNELKPQIGSIGLPNQNPGSPEVSYWGDRDRFKIRLTTRNERKRFVKSYFVSEYRIRIVARRSLPRLFPL